VPGRHEAEPAVPDHARRSVTTDPPGHPRGPPSLISGDHGCAGALGCLRSSLFAALRGAARRGAARRVKSYRGCASRCNPWTPCSRASFRSRDAPRTLARVDRATGARRSGT
jgi:hypothetical protein